MSRSRIRFDLLASRPARAVLRSPAFPVILQLGSLGVMILLALNGFGLGTSMRAEELMTFRKTNLTTLAVWGLWWPSMIAVALALGRAWCTVCPLELVNRAGDAVARVIGWPRARLGRAVRRGWMIVVTYLALQLLVAGVSIHRVPHHTAILLLVLLGAALGTGLVFRRPRSFCRGFCPAGALLSVYGRFTPFQLGPRDATTCEGCSTRDCIQRGHRHRFDRRSCPSELRPFDRDASDGCVWCLQCAKVCPHGNIGVGFARPDGPVGRRGLLRPYEAAFVMVALGFVAHEVIGEVRWLDSIFHLVPERLAAMVSQVPFGLFEALWFLLLFPTAVWASIAGVSYLAGHRAGARALLLAAATGAAPVVAIAHLAKAAAKVSSWSGFLSLSLRDPQGLATYRQLAAGQVAAPSAVVGLSVIGWLMLALVVILGWRALRWSRNIPVDATMPARVGLAGSAVLFAALLTTWALSGH